MSSPSHGRVYDVVGHRGSPIERNDSPPTPAPLPARRRQVLRYRRQWPNGGWAGRGNSPSVGAVGDPHRTPLGDRRPGPSVLGVWAAQGALALGDRLGGRAAVGVERLPEDPHLDELGRRDRPEAHNQGVVLAGDRLRPGHRERLGGALEFAVDDPFAGVADAPLDDTRLAVPPAEQLHVWWFRRRIVGLRQRYGPSCSFVQGQALRRRSRASGANNLMTRNRLLIALSMRLALPSVAHHVHLAPWHFGALTHSQRPLLAAHTQG